jgi:hypothetical protein
VDVHLRPGEGIVGGRVVREHGGHPPFLAPEFTPTPTEV